ncbi:Integrase OS=Streptomyces griseomycini OX=66895 GN=FHS37_007726 PE=4 SV=1 [Streptomyces griseomycini]
MVLLRRDTANGAELLVLRTRILGGVISEYRYIA